jgi:hypothetical protein
MTEKGLYVSYARAPDMIEEKLLLPNQKAEREGGNS